MTNKEAVETRILIARILGAAPDEVRYIGADDCFDKPHWYFVENDKFNTLLFFDEKPTEEEILDEIRYCDDISKEMDEEQS